ncbi:fibrinogen-like YCDxxxxGGGW domain-containing protein [Aquipuribacter hungaricus]|uniref:Fibrinogen-like YCDxxxxGGGW domain-containing protein n=1 Tax=Aquipuribacter hungaricus TaxID=545624 RepID=A0ABV7WD03_9MICO
MRRPRTPGTLSRSFAALVLAVTGSLAAGGLVAAPAMAASPVDGLTPQTAAASCWEVKQLQPSAPDGRYWLLTPALQVPQQFQCDMTTDGGGWVLVGRGREDWTSQYQGRGTTAEVSDVVTGPEAFPVRQLSSEVVDALLGGGRVDALTEGVRLRRAKDVGGTSWQETRVKLSKRDRWVWTLGAEHGVGTWSFDGVAGSKGQTNNFGADTVYRRVDTRELEARGYVWGFAYGAGVTGSTSATSHLWSVTEGGTAAMPFTQVWLRPRLTQASLGWTAVPDSGTPASTVKAMLSNYAEPQAWGVTGLANGRSGELNVEVQGFAQVGRTVYVGGNFRYVQKGSAGTERTEQPYLAGFDVQTGEWVSTFRPRLNGQVLALAALPDGRLVVGGEFTQANGAPAPALVGLDPVTGATDTTWRTTVENRISGAVVQVTSLDVEGPWLYAAGAFTHVGGGTRTTPVYARGAARIATTTGTPDVWNPAFNGTVSDIYASPQGDRLYAAGYFTMSNGRVSNKAAAVGTTPDAALALEWSPAYSTADRSGYQQAITEAAGRVWLGGSEHSFFSFDRSTFTRLSGNITKNGGDFQVAEVVGDVVYAGCHCNEWSYSDAYTWSNVGTSWTQADKIGFTGAWDTATGRTIPQYNPVMRARAGHGPWAMFEDSTGLTWQGGDFVSAERAPGRNQWVGGFVRQAQRDAVAPATPASAGSAAATATTSLLSWQPSAGATGYEVIHQDRVVAATASTSYEVPTPATGSERWFVRAVDAEGNRSASTPVVTVRAGELPPPPPAATAVVVPLGSTWSWAFDGVDRGTAWREPGYDASAWAAGPGRIGFNIGGEATLIPVSGTGAKPMTAYYVRTFELPESASRYGSLSLDLARDDGAVVYVNGVEVVRDNMPAGPIAYSTGASTTVSTTYAARTPVSFTVPATALRDGTNTVAVEVHQNQPYGNDMSFDLRLTVRPPA